jgi:hypothetical protein
VVKKKRKEKKRTEQNRTEQDDENQQRRAISTLRGWGFLEGRGEFTDAPGSDS